ncbi:MAG: thiol-disulfide oxidoreductase DCC family protein [Saprospiraceae bacterium]|nr:thiol-disulfide oxidoreductase DCC family protein [Saprospiraceae bacterium]
MEHVILLFDGECNLCNGTVQFILRRDPAGRFRFASLQSDAGRELLLRHGLDTESISTVVLIADDKAYTRSDAGLGIARRLGGLWPVLYAGMIVPRFIRDRIYNFIARNRYRWFGKRESCYTPTPELRGRFLA